MLFIVLLLFLSTAGALPIPDVVPMRFRNGALFRSILRENSLPQKTPNATSGWYDQLLNHSEEGGTTFKQRYWIDYSFWNGGDEALLYIPGEGPASGPPSGYPRQYGERRQMLLFTLENRYYGESLPAPLTDKETLLKYLNVDIALNDLRYFQIFVEEKIIGKKLRWLIVGGSYAGALSAWFKVKYPRAVLASWSSSGVVESRLNFYAYDGHIKQVLPRECADSARHVFLLFSKMWDDPNEREVFLKRFNIPSYFRKEEISYMLADAVAGGVQYGKKNVMCPMIVPLNPSDPLGTFYNMITTLFGDDFTSDCSYSTECLSNASFSNQWGSNYVWMYQTCSELAFFQVGYHGSLRLSDITTENLINQCRSAFGHDVFPDVFAFNEKWGGKNPRASNVVALQGSDDPWMEVGVSKTLSPSYQAFLAECEGCGHCGDLSTLTESTPFALRTQKEDLTRVLDVWMSSELQTYTLVLKGNFSTLPEKDPTHTSIQVDLHDSLDYSAEVMSVKVTHDARFMTILFNLYANAFNNESLKLKLIHLQKDSAWLKRTMQLLPQKKETETMLVISLKQRREEWPDTFLWTSLLNSYTLSQSVFCLFLLGAIGLSLLTCLYLFSLKKKGERKMMVKYILN